MVHIHPQWEWEDDSLPITGPAPKGVPGEWIIHYPGSPSMYEPRTDAQMIRSLRASQRSYKNSRGYSYGYSVVASQSGSLWAVRGIEGFPGVRVYNPASNPGRKVGGGKNNVTRSIQIAVGGQNPASPEAVASVNALIATQPDWPVRWHGEIDWTACAGEGIIEQIRQGIIGHQAPTPEPPKDEDMAMIQQYRSADTRVWPGKKLDGGEPYRFNIGDGVPKDATGAIATLTVTQPEGPGFLSVAAPADPILGETSCLNYGKGDTLANTHFVPLKNGQFDIQSLRDTHVVVDVVGYVK